MTRHNKKHYQRAEKNRPQLIFTGIIYLQYRDDESVAPPGKGDMKLFPSVEALHTIRQGDYWSTGTAGYFRVDIFDGREWRPVLLTDLFPEREHHFRKTECPIDTFELCSERLAAFTGRSFLRTYREHYSLQEPPLPSS